MSELLKNLSALAYLAYGAGDNCAHAPQTLHMHFV